MLGSGAVQADHLNRERDRTMLPPVVYTRQRLLVATAAVVVPALGYSALRRGAAQSAVDVATGCT